MKRRSNRVISWGTLDLDAVPGVRSAPMDEVVPEKRIHRGGASWVVSVPFRFVLLQPLLCLSLLKLVLLVFASLLFCFAAVSSFCRCVHS